MYMEEDKKPQEPTPPKPQPMAIRKNNNAPLVGAIVFLALVIGAAAIFLGTQKQNEQTTAIPTPTGTPTEPPTIQPTITTPLTDTTSWEIANISKLTDLSFPGYSIKHPEEWIAKETKDAVTHTLTITKGTSEIKIYQAPMGGSQCIFEGEMPDGPASDYRTSEFVEFSVGDVTFRRILAASGNGGKNAYTLCSKSLGNTNFNSPTTFGGISYSLIGSDPKTLSEMDEIVKTLKAL